MGGKEFLPSKVLEDCHGLRKCYIAISSILEKSTCVQQQNPKWINACKVCLTLSVPLKADCKLCWTSEVNIAAIRTDPPARRSRYNSLNIEKLGKRAKVQLINDEMQ